MDQSSRFFLGLTAQALIPFRPRYESRCNVVVRYDTPAIPQDLDGAVLDMDDTLGHTANVHAAVLKATLSLTAMDSETSDRTISRMFHEKRPGTGKTLWGEPYSILLPGILTLAQEDGHAQSLQFSEFKELYDAALAKAFGFAEALTVDVTEVTGARKLLTELHQRTGGKIAVYTGGPKLLGMLSLKLLKLDGLVREVLSTDDILPIGFTKSDSFGWVLACQAIGSSPRRTLAVTDHPKEALGAMQAHMRAFIRPKDRDRTQGDGHLAKYDSVLETVGTEYYPADLRRELADRLKVVNCWSDVCL